MEEYRNWLEAVIAEEQIAVQGGADDSKLKACEECLKKVVQLEDSGVDFCNLEIGKQYKGILKGGMPTVEFTVLDKGCDDDGDYIWYFNTTNNSMAFKRYKRFFNGVKYFREVQ